MALILLIEAHAIVREAIRRFLFPDHTVVAHDRWPTPDELGTHDLAIIDTETLARLGQDREEAAAMAARGRVPVVWLYSEDSSLPEADSSSAFLLKPLDGPAFGTAVREQLAAGTEGRGVPKGPGTIIELTEIIEEDLPEE